MKLVSVKHRTQSSQLTRLALCLLLLGAGVISCTSNQEKKNETVETQSGETTSTENSSSTASNVDPMKDKGVGPVSEVSVGTTVDDAMAAKGKAIFDVKCTPCHNPTDQKKVGPGLKGVTSRRTPEWIENMMLNPTEMTQKDPIAKDLLATHIAQMANQNLTQDEARQVLEYLRQNDKM